MKVTFDISEQTIPKLNWIMEVCEMDTRKELFDNAIEALYFCVKQSTERKEVGASGHTFTPLEMDCLEKARINWTTPPTQKG